MRAFFMVEHLDGPAYASVQVPFSLAFEIAPNTPKRLMLRIPDALTRKDTQRSSSGMKKRFLNRLGKKRRFVRRLEWETLFPTITFLPVN